MSEEDGCAYTIMTTVTHFIIWLFVLATGQQLILGAVFTAGIYIFLYMLFNVLTSGPGSFGGGGSHESNPGDGRQVLVTHGYINGKSKKL